MLYRNEQEVPLPPKAVETLTALIERHGEILAKDELMEIIWTDSIVEESNLAQYLHLLRKTLGTTADSQPFIETLRRRGYRFNPAISVRKVESAAIRSFSPPSLIGREEETAEIMDLLRREDVPLVTLTGVGGVGKTTLARNVLAQLSEEFSGDVVFIELAAITNGELVLSSIAAGLGIKETDDTPLLDSIKDNLRDRRLLLVLDNFEQVISASPYIAELL